MADDEREGEETPSRGNEWEVVSLTASTYAAAPSPEDVHSHDGAKGNNFGDDDEESSRAMFMSGHFVFPPSQHENLPLEPDDTVMHNEPGGEGVGTKDLNSDFEEGDKSQEKFEEHLNIQGSTVPDELSGIQSFDEKGKRLSIHGTEFAENTVLQGLNLVDEEKSIYEAMKFSSFHGEEDSGSTVGDETTVISEHDLPSQRNSDPPDLLNPPSPTNENKFDESGLPCEAWWKKRVTSLYSHAKEANAYWSVFVAAALMGLVILGHRWQQERWQCQQLRWKFCIGDEKMTRMLGPISRFKDVIVGGNRRGSSIRGSILAER